MVASPISINHLSLPLSEVWRVLTWREHETLGRILSERRADLGLSGTALAKSLREKHKGRGRSQSWISLIENDSPDADIMNLNTDVRYDLLKLYQFSDEELQALNDRFSLGLSAYLNNIGTPPPNSAIVWFTDVRNGEKGGIYPMRRIELDEIGVTEEESDALVIQKNVLMPEPLQAGLSNGMVLFFSPKVQPLPGDLMIYKYMDKDCYVVLEHEQDRDAFFITNIEQSDGDRIAKDDARLTFLGVSFGHYNPRRRGRPS